MQVRGDCSQQERCVGGVPALGAQVLTASAAGDDAGSRTVPDVEGLWRSVQEWVRGRRRLVRRLSAPGTRINEPVVTLDIRVLRGSSTFEQLRKHALLSRGQRTQKRVETLSKT